MKQTVKKALVTGPRLIRTLLVTLLVLIVIIILLLLRSCGAERQQTVLEPDYAPVEVDPGAKPIEGEKETAKPEVTSGGGSVTISFRDDVTYQLSTGTVSLFYQNPSASTHDVVVQIILVRDGAEYLLAQSGRLEPGYQVTSLQRAENAPRLSAGGYDGKLKLLFYDRETGERAMVDTDIPCTVTVSE